MKKLILAAIFVANFLFCSCKKEFKPAMATGNPCKGLISLPDLTTKPLPASAGDIPGNFSQGYTTPVGIWQRTLSSVSGQKYAYLPTAALSDTFSTYQQIPCAFCPNSATFCYTGLGGAIPQLRTFSVADFACHDRFDVYIATSYASSNSVFGDIKKTVVQKYGDTSFILVLSSDRQDTLRKIHPGVYQFVGGPSHNRADYSDSLASGMYGNEGISIAPHFTLYTAK